VELPDKRMAPLSGVRFELFGISVQTPWGKMGTIRLAPSVAMIPSPEQHIAMTLFNPESDDFERRMFAQATHVRDDLTVISSYKLMVAEMDDHA
jgi:hypothetical protein